jgi:hypothetical protein
MCLFFRLSTIFTSIVLVTTLTAAAQEPIKIGVLLPFAGPLAYVSDADAVAPLQAICKMIRPD